MDVDHNARQADYFHCSSSSWLDWYGKVLAILTEHSPKRRVWTRGEKEELT